MASKNKPVVKKAGKKKNGYEQPKHLKAGTILIDNHKKQWKIGVSIGIYFANIKFSGTNYNECHFLRYRWLW